MVKIIVIVSFIVLIIVVFFLIILQQYSYPLLLPETTLPFSGGKATVTIKPVVEIHSSTSFLDFGRGHVSPRCSRCVLGTASIMDTACCLGFTSPAFGILIENTGNRNVSLNYSCSGSCSAQQFFGGTFPTFQLTVTPDSIHSHAPTDHAGHHDTLPSCYGITQEYSFDVHSQGAWLCGNSTSFNLESEPEKDSVIVDVLLTIPADAEPSPAPQKAKFTFTAHSLDPSQDPTLGGSVQ